MFKSQRALQKGSKIIWPTLVILIAAACIPESTEISPVPTSPYVNLLDSELRGLSPEEIQDLQSGAGSGLARAAELNGYPGPVHILEMQEQLELTEEQLVQVQSLYEGMNAEAREFGGEIIKLEGELERSFREQSVDEKNLERMVQNLAVKYGELRLVHLRTHLAAIDLLTPDQLVRYSHLRGYTEASGGDHQHEHP
jgi:hypothetical protein